MIMHRHTLCLQSQGKTIREDLDMSENLYRKVTAEEIEYEKQESCDRFMLDMNTMKSVADREGFDRGRNEGEKLGLERGAANEKREIAKNMNSILNTVETILL